MFKINTYFYGLCNIVIPEPGSWDKARFFHASPSNPYRTASHTLHVAVGLEQHPNIYGTLNHHLAQ
jgi:hypothetical protein